MQCSHYGIAYVKEYMDIWNEHNWIQVLQRCQSRHSRIQVIDLNACLETFFLSFKQPDSMKDRNIKILYPILKEITAYIDKY